jgi:hypothetical protein
VRSLLDWLNSNAGAFNVLFAAVVAAATVFYALLTRALVAETRRMREAQTEPQVTIRVESSEQWINFLMLIIENIGGGAAYELRLAATPDFEDVPGRPLSAFGPFKHGVRMLAPRQRISTLLVNIVGRASEIEHPEEPLAFSVRAQYRGALGKQYDESFPIDFKHLVGSRTLGKPPLHAIAGSLDDIQKTLSKLGGTAHRLQVVAYAPDDLKCELDEELADLSTKMDEQRDDGEPTA